jgi:hypothetical protein
MSRKDVKEGRKEDYQGKISRKEDIKEGRKVRTGCQIPRPQAS